VAPHIYLLTIILPLAALVFVFSVKYASAAFQAHAVRKSDLAYRALAEEALAAQRENKAALAAVREELAALSATVTAIAVVLNDV
jgi:hypothetical protein